MGRPKLEKPTTSKERMQKYRKDEAKRASENRRRADARKKKNENVTLTEEELEEKRRNARERKRLSRANIDANSSRQKRIGRKVKDKNRKVRSRNQQNLSPPLHCTNSTSRVRSHRERLKVKIGTLCGGVSKTGRRKVAAAKKSMTATLKALSPGERNSVLDVSLTPKTKKTVAESYNDTTGSAMGLFKTLAPHRDKLSNCTRQLILGSLSLNKSASRSNWTSLQRAKSTSTSNILVHYKTKKMKKVKPPSETTKLVQAFYNKDNVSRILPYKKLTCRVKDHTGVYQRVSVRVMEVTLKKAVSMFKALHPEVKICRRTFESLRPKNIRLTRCAQRLQCGCTYHTNMEYIRKACNHLLIINGKDAVLSTNDTLIAAAICDAKSLKCIMGKCKDCKAFAKIDELKLESLKCCKDCIKKGNDCKSHTVKVRQFERVTYMHQGKEKKKMALVDKMVKLDELVHLLKLKLNDFPRHRFNVQHTSEVYDELVSNIDDHIIVKVHDFSENYTCLLPDEIQSLHWTQDTATVYPVVVLRKVNEDVREDHITFLTDDKKHDVPFVELCNSRLHEHYMCEGVSITHDVEYNDGCASQFKCIRAFAALARRNTKTTRIFCETSHGKSKSDGLGGVVKCYASRCVCSEKRVIRNAKELYEFFEERLVVQNAFDSPKPMLNRLFHFISSEEIEEYRSSFPDEAFKYIPGTLQIHQVVTTPGDKSHQLQKHFMCLYELFGRRIYVL